MRLRRIYSISNVCSFLEVFYTAYAAGEEPEDESWVLDFGEWASVYRTWLGRQAAYRDEIHRMQRNGPSLEGLVRVAS